MKCASCHSITRQQAGLQVIDHGAPIDVLWFRLPKDEGDRSQTGGHVWPGLFFVTLDRGDYWQCAYVIPKGQGEAVRQALPALREQLARRVPFFADNLRSLQDPQQLKLLEVQVNRLRRWHAPGLLCIGDAAHAMSPVGGVGINLAVQDAVAAARILAAPLRAGTIDESHLRAVQKRREWPARVTQWVQVLVQDRVVRPVLESTAPETQATALPLPWPLRMMRAFPLLRRIPARMVGVGVRPEHVTEQRLRPCNFPA
jgi:2-polyprenyl-6-methoxyphenol hydroxylase-like FAD-dependent oxidoreductase